MMLVSVLPHKYFISFLQEEKRSFLPYLQIIHIYKLYENEYQTLKELEIELDEIADIKGSFISSNSGLTKKSHLSTRKENKMRKKLIKEIEKL
jgi:hypothetical protein